MRDARHINKTLIVSPFFHGVWNAMKRTHFFHVELVFGYPGSAIFFGWNPKNELLLLVRIGSPVAGCILKIRHFTNRPWRLCGSRSSWAMKKP